MYDSYCMSFPGKIRLKAGEKKTHRCNSSICTRNGGVFFWVYVSVVPTIVCYFGFERSSSSAQQVNMHDSTAVTYLVHPRVFSIYRKPRCSPPAPRGFGFPPSQRPHTTFSAREHEAFVFSPGGTIFMKKKSRHEFPP